MKRLTNDQYNGLLPILLIIAACADRINVESEELQNLVEGFWQIQIS